MSNQATEKFTLACPQCGEIVTVQRAHIGKKGRCGVCHNVFPITAPDGGAVRPAPAALQLQPLGPAQPKATDIWSEAAATPIAPPPQESPMVSYANDLLQQAKNKKTVIEEEESDATYRFVTSYGSVIGGIFTMVLGLFLTLIALLVFGSPKLAAACILMIIAGCGWLVQGLNYVTYYYWKDRGGRK